MKLTGVAKRHIDFDWTLGDCQEAHWLRLDFGLLPRGTLASTGLWVVAKRHIGFDWTLGYCQDVLKQPLKQREKSNRTNNKGELKRQKIIGDLSATAAVLDPLRQVLHQKWPSLGTLTCFV
jgi:hypothetical protein